MVGETGKKDSKSPKLIKMEFLKVINEAQQQHGLRHGDYQRYRGYCSRRLRRIRKSLSFTQGDRKGFKKKEVTPELLKDEKFLLIPLVTAERAWSCAMLLKQESNSEPRKRFHMLARLKKAALLATQLHTLVEESGVCAPISKLEAQAYAAWMEGALAFEMQDWKAARDHFLKAQTIYENVGELVNEGDRDIYVSKVAQLKPSLRFCSYNIDDDSSLDNIPAANLPPDLQELLLRSRGKETSKELFSVKWQNRTVEVPERMDKVRVFLVSLSDSERAINSADTKRKLELYDSLLLRCKDALSILRDDPACKPRDKESWSPIQHLYNYLNYIRLNKTIDRNLVMIDSGSGKAAEVIRLYELIMQNLLEIQQIPGMEDDCCISNQSLAYKALRCFGIAEWFRNNGRWAETLALYKRASSYVNEVSNLSNSLQSRLNKAVSSMETYKITARAQAHLMTTPKDQSKPKKEQRKKMLIDNLDYWFDDVPDMLDFPPKWRPIPCKPLFFDLAENHLEMPSLDDKLSTTVNKEQPGGLSGFVRGLWGWGSKK